MGPFAIHSNKQSNKYIFIVWKYFSLDLEPLEWASMTNDKHRQLNGNTTCVVRVQRIAYQWFSHVIVSNVVRNGYSIFSVVVVVIDDCWEAHKAHIRINDGEDDDVDERTDLFTIVNATMTTRYFKWRVRLYVIGCVHRDRDWSNGWQNIKSQHAAHQKR